MLDAITDFWKPVKKAGPQARIDTDRLQVGSEIAFGYVPQTLLSGKRFKVAAINTYVFGDERMTSFVLANDWNEDVSLIIGDTEGEQYLAISRRIPFVERMKMLDTMEIDAILEQSDAARLKCREPEAGWKYWVVGEYRKEIADIDGYVVKGDYRGKPAPSAAEGVEFNYFLLLSDNNEYAIDVEKYGDGRLEFFATIYRRMGDITDVLNLGPPSSAFPAIEASAPAAPVVEKVISLDVAREPEQPLPPTPVVFERKQPEPTNVFTFAPTQPVFNPEPVKETTPMNTTTLMNGSSSTETRREPQVDVSKPMVTSVFNPDTFENKPKKETAVMTRNSAALEMDNEAIECDLRVANKIIDEAIRNELRLSDVVRKVIALPLANPESVQIPITLSDEDFQLLAIRYGIPANDRNTIKKRIIDELTISGDKKK